MTEGARLRMLHQAPSAVEARQARLRIMQAAAWLQGVWCDVETLPSFGWSTLNELPDWAFGTPEQLERLALLAGVLCALPSLRRRLDAEAWSRVRRWVGTAMLDRLLALPDEFNTGAPWPEGDEMEARRLVQAWGSALLASSVAHPLLRDSLVRALRLPPAWMHRGWPTHALATRLTRQALDLAEQSLNSDAEAPAAQSPGAACGPTVGEMTL